MPIWTPPGQLYREQNSWTAPTSPMGITVTGSATIHTKGAWTELIASTSFEALFVRVNISSTSAATTATETLVDIGIGAAAAEQVIIPDLLGGYVGAIGTAVTAAPRIYEFPLRIPAGSRIAARLQSLVASKTARLMISIFGEPRYPASVWAGSTVTAYGIVAASSRGTLVTPGASGAEGAWTEIVASSTTDHSALVIGSQGVINSVITAHVYAIDVAAGAAAAEQVLASDRIITANTSEQNPGLYPSNALGVTIPTGTRLAARASGHTTSPQALDVALYGVS